MRGRDGGTENLGLSTSECSTSHNSDGLGMMTRREEQAEEAGLNSVRNELLLQ